MIVWVAILTIYHNTQYKPSLLTSAGHVSEEGVLEALQRGGPPLGVELQHGRQEGGERLGLLHTPVVLVHLETRVRVRGHQCCLYSPAPAPGSRASAW